MPFGCRGHEFASKGLQGCGVATRSAAVGAEFSFDFVAIRSNADGSVTTARATRVVRVASPCARGEVHCPGLQVACGTASCAVRASLGAAEDDSASNTHVALRFSQFQSNAGATELAAALACGLPPPLPLTFCKDGAAGCGVYAATDDAAISLARSLVLPSNLSAPLCPLSAAQGGLCTAGSHRFRYQALLNGSAVSGELQLQLDVGTRLASLRVNVTAALDFEASGSASSSSIRAQLLALHPGSHVTNGLLQDAAARLAAVTRSGGCAADPQLQIEPGGILSADLRTSECCNASVGVHRQSPDVTAEVLWTRRVRRMQLVHSFHKADLCSPVLQLSARYHEQTCSGIRRAVACMLCHQFGA